MSNGGGYLLDTDHVTYLLRGAGAEYDRITARTRRAAAAGLAVRPSIVSFQKSTQGRLAALNRLGADLTRGYAVLDRVRQFYVGEIWPYDDAAIAFEALRDLAPKAVGGMDLRIAAVAQAIGLTLLTRNARDFARVPGLRFEDWTAPAAP